MLRLSRPGRPGKFDEAVASDVTRIKRAVQNGKQLKFNNKWGDFKDKFSEAQHGKCGYCETFVVAGQDGDVEHYRPKGRIDEIREKGAEKDNLGNVKGRKFTQLKKPGYWWLAYDWGNYLLSCGNCNRKWKKNVFPVSGRRARNPRTNERALLLNPFDRADPANHLSFDDLGAVTPAKNSNRGDATIEVCGLDRPSLTRARLEKSRTAHRLADELKDALRRGSRSATLSALRGFKDAGDERFIFAGFVRSVLKQECGMTWKELLNQVPDS